jgi:dipeptidase E
MRDKVVCRSTMPKTNLLLISNSQQPGYKYLGHAESHICAFLGTSVQEVLFIPYASVLFSYDRYAKKVRRTFEGMGYRLKSLHEVDDPIREIRAAQALVGGGGNTFQLLKCLYEMNLLGAIRQSVRAGIPYMGFSAGANIAGATIKTTNDMPVASPPSLDALGLVPFQINPHYTDALPPDFNGETRDARIAEYLVLNPDRCVVGLREGTMLHIDGTKVSLIGGKSIKVFFSRPPQAFESALSTVGEDGVSTVHGAFKEYGADESLDFLMGPGALRAFAAPL